MAETFRKTGKFFGRLQAACRTAIQKLVNKFELLGQISDVENKIRARRSAENIAAIAESIDENPVLFIPSRFLQ